MHHILIAENNPLLQTQLKQELSDEYTCHTSASLEESYNLIDTRRIDLVILDRMLDDGDGIEIAEYLRSISNHTRILFLSKQADTQDRIAGLEIGGDDYLAKPFSLVELKLKIKKLINSYTATQNANLQLGTLQLSEHSGVLTSPSIPAPVCLRKKEALILACLIRHKNQVISRERIRSEVWGCVITQPSHSTIDAYIRKIRMSLASEAWRIKTIRGFGYRAME